MNVLLVALRDVVVQGEQEGEGEEEAEALEKKLSFAFPVCSPRQKVPDVVVVEVVEPLEAGLVELLWEGGARHGALDLRLEEVHRGKHEDAAENEEDKSRPRQPLSRQVLHHEVEGEVHRNVGEEDEEEDGREVCGGDEQEEHAEDGVDGHEDDQKPKSER